MGFRILALSLVLCYVLTAPAVALELIRGSAVQGGLIVLKAQEGASLSLNDVELMTSEEGYAVVGFHYDDIAPITIIETRKDGTQDSLTLSPQKRKYKTQRIDGLPNNFVSPPEDVLNRIKQERAMVAAARNVMTPDDAFAEPFIWPLHGIITGVYGSRRILNGKPRSPHYGIDIAAPKGTAIKAPQSGTVRLVQNLYFTGWTIILDHGHGVSSAFLHLDAPLVAVGDNVIQGQIIGKVGSTGRSTGAHLDWRVNLFGKRLDPALLVGAMPSQ